jgi:hypothetical protein
MARILRPASRAAAAAPDHNVGRRIVSPGSVAATRLGRRLRNCPRERRAAAIDTYLENEAVAYRAGNTGKLAGIVNDRLDAAAAVRLCRSVGESLCHGAGCRGRGPTPAAFRRCRKIALLVVVASGPNSRATVVLTVRADFVHQTHPAEHAAAAAAGEHTFRWGLATCGARSRRLPRKWGFRLREGWVRVGRACDSPRVKKHLCNQELRTRRFVDCTPI